MTKTVNYSFKLSSAVFSATTSYTFSPSQSGFVGVLRNQQGRAVSGQITGEDMLAETKRAVALLSQKIDPSEDEKRFLALWSCQSEADELLRRRTEDSIKASVCKYEDAILHLEELGHSGLLEGNEQAFALMYMELYYSRAEALVAMRTREGLNAARTSYEESILRGSQIDLSNAVNLGALAACHIRLVDALGTISTPNSLQDAMFHCNESIRLYSKTNQSLPKYCRALASAYRTRGEILSVFGTAESFRRCRTDFSQSIRLHSTLDMSDVESVSNLVLTLFSKGSALIREGTGMALNEAVSTLDEAIRLSSSLDLANNEFRFLVARLHSSRADVIVRSGIQNNAYSALVDYDEALRLSAGTEQSESAFRRFIADTVLERATYFFRTKTPAALVEAASSLDEAIRIYKTFDQPIDTEFHNLALAHLRRGLVAEQLKDHNSAIEHGLKASNLLSSEALNKSVFTRPTREQAFQFLMNTLVKNEVVGQIPEIVLINLSPERSGSDPTSYSMHCDGLNALIKGLLLCSKNVDLQSHLPKFFDSIDKMKSIRNRYFSGTFEGVMLRAREFEAREDNQSAEDVLRKYCKDTFIDAGGWCALAEMLNRHGRLDEAKLAYIKAARSHLVSLAEISNESRGARVAAIGTIASIFFGLEVSDALQRVGTQKEDKAAWSSVISAVSRKGAQHWIDFLRMILTSAEDTIVLNSDEHLEWQTALEPVLQDAWNPIALQVDSLRENLLLEEGRVEGRHEMSSVLKKAIDAMRGTAMQSAALPQGNLSTGWQEFVQKLQFALSDVLTHVLDDADSPDGLRRGTLPESLQEEVDSALSRAFERHTSVLDFPIDACHTHSLAQWLGPDWQVQLSENERRMLLAGVRLLETPELSRYAGLELGLAVEASLRTHLFERLQKRSNDPAIISAPVGRKSAALTLKYVQKKGTLTLGAMFQFISLTVSTTPSEAEPHPVVVLSRQELAKWPGYSMLEERLGSVDGQAAINEILDIRNNCAHATDAPDRDKIVRMLDCVISDEHLGFFRYWTNARLSQHTATPIAS